MTHTTLLLADVKERVANFISREKYWNNVVLTEKEASIQLLKIWQQNKAEALADDLEQYARLYSERIETINEYLKTL